jgi:hypothetical protein
MAGLSDWAEVAVLNALLRNTSLVVTTPYISLHTADPGDSGAANELTDSGYARKSATFSAPTSGAGTTSNSADITFNAISDAGPFTVTHCGIWSAVSGGNLLISAALTTSKQFSQNDVPRFPTGSLTVTAA